MDQNQLQPQEQEKKQPKIPSMPIGIPLSVGEDTLASEIKELNAEKLKKSLLNFIVPLVCLLITFAISFIIIVPGFKEIPTLKESLEVSNSKISVLESKVTILKKLSDFVAVLDENSELVDRVLVSEADAPKLLDQINQIAGNSALVITKLNYSYSGSENVSAKNVIAVAESVPFSSINVSLGVDGNYEQLVILLENIENAARLINVDSFRYGLSNEKENVTGLSGNFTLQSPYLYVDSSAVTDDPVTLDISSQRFVGFINKIKALRYYDYLETVPAVKAEEVTPEELNKASEKDVDTTAVSVADTPVTDEETEEVTPFSAIE